VTGPEYRRALQAAAREYEALGRERSRLEARIAQLAQTIGSLGRLCGVQSTTPSGLTDSVRTVLQGAEAPLTALDVRERLGAMGFDLERYSSDLAAIHTVLKRLNVGGEARAVALAGKSAYGWTGPRRVIAIAEADLKTLMDPDLAPARPKKERRK